jgi:hypothetical protein
MQCAHVFVVRVTDVDFYVILMKNKINMCHLLNNIKPHNIACTLIITIHHDDYFPLSSSYLFFTPFCFNRTQGFLNIIFQILMIQIRRFFFRIRLIC